ncbi:DUF2388 domain-containing protein [Bdellovibrio sp. HCB2-146]|uniref:DUF2388 domain-containing protein n=1 Tax=Bdellovibrio sp. HCB2-146 TaxID=3394362 RepID=UPI0039BD0BC8
MKVWAILLSMVVAQTAMAIHPSGLTASSQSTFSKAVAGEDAERRIIREANDDALTFIGSEGQIRGSLLEDAIKVIRENHPDMTTHSDAQLAEAIVEANRVYDESNNGN